MLKSITVVVKFPLEKSAYVSKRSPMFCGHKLGVNSHTVKGLRTFSTSEGKLAIRAEQAAGSKSILYKLPVPLPSNEKCVFSIKGDQTIKQFVSDLKEEDSNVNNCAVYTSQGERVALSTEFNSILGSSFVLKINNNNFTVSPTVVAPNSTIVADVNPEEVERIKSEFLPLYLQKRNIDNKATRFSNLVIYGGLGFLVAQWGVMARLTWWNFNWDIMEPVTYFVTFGTAILGYTYFVLTKREYTFGDLRESIRDSRAMKHYLKSNFEIDRYFALENKLLKADPEAILKIDAQLEAASHEPAPQTSQ